MRNVEKKSIKMSSKFAFAQLGHGQMLYKYVYMPTLNSFISHSMFFQRVFSVLSFLFCFHFFFIQAPQTFLSYIVNKI